MSLIKSIVSRDSAGLRSRFSARSAMPAGTASELRQAISRDLFQRLFDGLERRNLTARRVPCR